MVTRFTCDFSFVLNIIEGVMVCQIFRIMFLWFTITSKQMDTCFAIRSMVRER
jgi:hypothetical protein